jgi:ABC-type transport system involved in cytochrome c biogenesis permease subunit
MDRSWFGVINSERIPPLATLDSLITSSMSFGFVAITLAVIAGSTWASIEMGARWISQPKIAVSLITWGFWLLMVFLRVSAGWRGRKAAILALTVLGFCALTWAAHVGLRPMLMK